MQFIDLDNQSLFTPECKEWANQHVFKNQYRLMEQVSRWCEALFDGRGTDKLIIEYPHDDQAIEITWYPVSNFYSCHLFPSNIWFDTRNSDLISKNFPWHLIAQAYFILIHDPSGEQTEGESIDEFLQTLDLTGIGQPQGR